MEYFASCGKIRYEREERMRKEKTCAREHCEVSQWEKEQVIPKEELIARTKGKDGIFCILENKVWRRDERRR